METPTANKFQPFIDYVNHLEAEVARLQGIQQDIRAIMEIPDEVPLITGIRSRKAEYKAVQDQREALRKKMQEMTLYQASDWSPVILEGKETSLTAGDLRQIALI